MTQALSQSHLLVYTCEDCRRDFLYYGYSRRWCSGCRVGRKPHKGEREKWSPGRLADPVFAARVDLYARRAEYFRQHGLCVSVFDASHDGAIGIEASD